MPGAYADDGAGATQADPAEPPGIYQTRDSDRSRPSRHGQAGADFRALHFFLARPPARVYSGFFRWPTSRQKEREHDLDQARDQRDRPEHGSDSLRHRSLGSAERPGGAFVRVLGDAVRAGRGPATARPPVVSARARLCRARAFFCTDARPSRPACAGPEPPAVPSARRFDATPAHPPIRRPSAPAVAVPSAAASTPRTGRPRTLRVASAPAVCPPFRVPVTARCPCRRTRSRCRPRRGPRVRVTLRRGWGWCC